MRWRIAAFVVVMVYAAACVCAAIWTIYAPGSKTAIDWLGTLAMMGLGAAIVVAAVVLFFTVDHAPEQTGLD